MLATGITFKKLNQETMRKWTIRQSTTALSALHNVDKILQGHIRGLLVIGVII